jgi:phosphatidylglycerophosphate synthase
MSWKDEYWQTIKSFDTEEKLDLYFYRALGFLIAKTAKILHMSPDALTVIGAGLGIAACPYFLHDETNRSLVIGSLLFVFAGVFDSADGQLARLGNKGTKFGIVLDGICDNIVFGSVYIGCILATLSHSQWNPVLFWAIAFFAGFCHSFESSVLDFYNRDYLAFGYGKTGDSGNPSYEDLRSEYHSARGSDRIFLGLRMAWVWQQTKVSCREPKERKAWHATLAGPRASEFQELYRQHNRTILRAWRLMGANFHTICIILFAFLRRFDLYLIGVDILFLPLALLFLRGLQAGLDARLNQTLRARGLV